MEKNFNFDDMRPYNDNEFREVMSRVTGTPELRGILQFICPNMNPDDLLSQLRRTKTVYDFQHQFIAPVILSTIEKNKSIVELHGIEKIDKNKKYLHISNHRDIIMDAGILNSLMDQYGFDTTEIAIGDNLCAKQWISDCLRLNRCFLVKRSGTKRELFDAFVKLSAYIRRDITEMRSSIWIAQREGRAKDSDDRTQESMLKMLSVSAVGSLKQSFIDLNIAPVSISYEYDSCDYLKAKEFQQKRDDANFQKSKEDDILNMKVGILGYKGHICYELTDTINEEIEEIVNEEDNRATILNKVALIINKRIHENYHLFPNNYVALDNLNKETQYLGDKYQEEDKKNFEAYVDSQIEKIDLPNKDIPFLKEKFWLMYANPLINYLKATNP